MKIVFVLPPYDYSRSMGNTRKKAQIGLLPPLGVGYLAAYVEKHGHTAALVDAVAEQLDVEQATEAVAQLQPDAVGISSFTTLTPNDAYALARELRRRLPETPLIMGGPHVTSFAKTILNECPEVDILIPGDGEIPLNSVLTCLSERRSCEEVPGILFRGPNGEIVATPKAEIEKDLDQFPHPARHIYKHHLYLPLPSLSARRPVTSMITSRGCPWGRCKFCYQGGEYASSYRRRTPGNVMEEITSLVRDHGIRNIVFWDDNFCFVPKWIEAFCDLLEGSGYGLVWSVLSRVNTISPEMLRRMAKAGCYSIQFGVESGHAGILEMVNKGHSLEQCRQAVKWAQEAGMDTRAFFMLGFPTETPEMSDQTIRFACELNVDYAIFFSYHVQPGTALADLALCEGRCGDFHGQHLPSYLPNTYPSAEALGEKVKEAYRRYYFRPAYIRRALVRLLRKPSLIKNHFLGLYYWLGLMLRG